MTNYATRIMYFGDAPVRAFEPGGCLHGFTPANASELRQGARDRVVLDDDLQPWHAARSYEAADEEMVGRIRALCSTYGWDELIKDNDGPDEWYSSDEQLHRHEDGRLALIGTTSAGDVFILEAELTCSGLAHEHRECISKYVVAIWGLENASGDKDDIETLRDALNALEEIKIEINDELNDHSAGTHRFENIDEMTASAACALDTCDLPSWAADPDEAWSVSKAGRYAMYPPDSSLCGLGSSDMLSTDRAGWRIDDLCAGETYYVEDDGCVLLAAENHGGGPSLLAPTDEGIVQAGIVLRWVGDPVCGWMLHDEDTGIEQRLDRPADWNPTLWGWAS